MNLLIVSPSAPPKNGPEAIQVGRLLEALDPAIHISLVTTPGAKGWIWEDQSLSLSRKIDKVVTVSLPIHKFSSRVLGSRHLGFLHVPDSDFWIKWSARQVLRKLQSVPDIVYSRSSPFSSALLAAKLSKAISRPWVMHMSDPWYDSPYRPGKESDRRLEGVAIARADLVTLTTTSQVEIYRDRYPDHRGKIKTSFNMMPYYNPGLVAKDASGPLNIVYTGALYGEREPSTLIRALVALGTRRPEYKGSVQVNMYGNVDGEIEKVIHQSPYCQHHGRLSYGDIYEKQAGADVLLTIEPHGDNQFYTTFMPSKTMDYLACRKPIWAVTPAGSETAKLCAKGYGDAFDPGDYHGLSTAIESMIDRKADRRENQELPSLGVLPYSPQEVAAELSNDLYSVMDGWSTGK